MYAFLSLQAADMQNAQPDRGTLELYMTGMIAVSVACSQIPDKPLVQELEELLQTPHTAAQDSQKQGHHLRQ